MGEEVFTNRKALKAKKTYDREQGYVECVTYISCVSLDEIEEIKPWNQSRLERVRKWATPENLRRVYVDPKRHVFITDLPYVGRRYKTGEKPPKFKITSGVHRIVRARELQMKCILALVEECRFIPKPPV